MKINQNLQKLSSYAVEILDKSIQRKHSNESEKPIISMEILSIGVLENMQEYPELQYEKLVHSAAKFYNCDAQFTIPVNGSDEGLDLILRTFCNSGEVIAVLNPTFSMYFQFATILGLQVLQFNLNFEDFTLNVDEFIEFCLKNKVKMAIIPNPLAPSGGVIKREDLVKIVSKLPETFVVIDEAYIEFSKEESMISHIGANFPGLIVTRTCSKFFGLAGVRLGFVFTAQKDNIFKVKSPYNVNNITCGIGINLFTKLTPEIIQQKHDDNLIALENLRQWLVNFPEIHQIYPSSTNFLFIKLLQNSGDFAQKLLDTHKIKIKAFSGDFAKFCRIST